MTTMTEQVVSVGNVRLWTQTVGDPESEPLLLIGSHSAMEWPDEFVQTLAAQGDHLVIRYDQRNNGRTTFLDYTEHPYDFDDLAADAIAVLDAYGFGSAHLACFARGAAVGQIIAMDYPERLRSLTLFGAAALSVDFFGNCERAFTGEPTPDGMPTPHRWVLELLDQHEQTKDRESELDRRVTLAKALAGVKPGQKAPDDAEADFRRWEERAMDHAGSLRPYTAHPYVAQDLTVRGDRLGEITAPTIVIEGPLDPIHPPPHSGHLAASIPGARLVTIPGLGHVFPAAVHRPLTEAIKAHTHARRSS